jgi:hypothetical protein
VLGHRKGSSYQPWYFGCAPPQLFPRKPGSATHSSSSHGGFKAARLDRDGGQQSTARKAFNHALGVLKKGSCQWRGMMTTYRIDITLLPASPLLPRHNLALEIAALGQQLALFKRKQPRPPHPSSGPAALDLSPPFLAPWSGSLILVNPETVVCGIAPALNHWPIGRRSAAPS